MTKASFTYDLARILRNVFEASIAVGVNALFVKRKCARYNMLQKTKCP